MGREPSIFQPRGQAISGKGTAPRKKSLWTIESDLDESAAFEEHIEALLSILELSAKGVRAAVDQFGAGVNYYAWRETVNPGFHLTSAQIIRLGALRLSVDFDVYAIEPDTE